MFCIVKPMYTAQVINVTLLNSNFKEHCPCNGQLFHYLHCNHKLQKLKLCHLKCIIHSISHKVYSTDITTSGDSINPINDACRYRLYWISLTSRKVWINRKQPTAMDPTCRLSSLLIPGACCKNCCCCGWCWLFILPCGLTACCWIFLWFKFFIEGTSLNVLVVQAIINLLRPEIFTQLSKFW